MSDLVAVVGLGALGGAVARGVRSTTEKPVVGWDLDPGAIEEALEAGVLTRGAGDLGDAVEGASVVVIATPLGALERVLLDAAAMLGASSMVLDVGSLQAPPLSWAEAAGLAARFVACHPLAGTHRSGFGASADVTLEGCRVWLSAPPEADGRLLERAADFWSALGARPEVVDPAVHDTRMAVLSHLPQVTANVLASVIEKGGFAVGELGPGGRDMTRLAASGPELWRDLLEHSGAQVAQLLRLTAREMESWARVLDAQDLDELERRLGATRQWRGR